MHWFWRRVVPRLIATVAIGLWLTPPHQAVAADAVRPLRLEPIVRLEGTNGLQRLTALALKDAATQPGLTQSVAFLAVAADDWPEGLVPLYVRDADGPFELRRRPLRGQENHAAPLCFVLPPEDELETARLAGRWECLAMRPANAKNYLAFELTMDGEHVVGRFDQNTDYRFAYITGGTFRSNRLELAIDYIMDHYQLTGQWRAGAMSGTWRRTDDSERGTWEATRPTPRPPLPASKLPVPLYEWWREDASAKRYGIESDPHPPGWRRAARPLGRVWPK